VSLPPRSAERSRIPALLRGRAGAAQVLACLPLVASLLFAPGLACTTMGAAGDSVALRVETNVPDAIIWVDDRLVGTAASLVSSGTRLRVGFHRIEIRHPSHYSFFTEVDPKRGEDVVIRAQLHELVQ
jgi:hypothetical protein